MTKVDEHLTSWCSDPVMHTNTSGNFVLVVVIERKSEICPQECLVSELGSCNNWMGPIKVSRNLPGNVTAVLMSQF